MIDVGSERRGGPPPSVARLYDYALGGKDNYAVDRALFARLSAVYPEYRAFAIANRSFLTYAVREMAHAGIDQFLDLGAGLPTSPSVHETACAVNPDAVVVYVDNDPIVLAHCRALLAPRPGTTVVGRDIRDPAALLADPAVRRALDFTRPIGLLCVAVLHFVAHPEALRVLAEYRAALPTGSAVALSAHVQDPERDDPELQQEGADIGAALSTSIIARTPQQVGELLTGFTIQHPGVVDIAAWRPGVVRTPLWCFAGIGRLEADDPAPDPA